ncbi:MAG: response regulator [Lachnospiraceae bacterium]
MEKIKIFLVEDEIIIRNGIKNGIEWEKEGYEFVGEASDGELAYPMILKKKPDILITDIKMPFMDGLELSRLVKKEIPNLKILILSGYDEFDYAKEAIRLGVTEYLLKPVSASKLLESLHGVSRLILQEREEKELLKKYSEEMRENTEHEKMKFFGQLISGNFSMSELIETGKRYGINLNAQMYEIILFKIMNVAGRYVQSTEVIEACESLEKMLSKTPYVYCFQRGVDGWAFLLTAEDKEQIGQKTRRFVERIKNMMSNWNKLEYFGGIGRPVLRVRELRQSFADADYAFSGRFMNVPNQILNIEEIENTHELENFEVKSFGEMERTRGTIEKFLNNGTQEEIDSFTKVYVNEIPVENLKSTLMRQYIIMDIYIVIMSFCEKLEISDQGFGSEAEKFKEAIQKIHKPNEICGYMKRLLEKALELRDKASGRRYSDIIEAAKTQIEKTYMSEDISLNTVAASVGMSPSYFSSVFSREMGKTFVEYLTGIRMDKAKELLMCSPMKTSEIGYEVGYKDPHYFSYIFKKTQGCSPKEYRARRKE